MIIATTTTKVLIKLGVKVINMATIAVKYPAIAKLTGKSPLPDRAFWLKNPANIVTIKTANKTSRFSAGVHNPN